MDRNARLQSLGRHRVQVLECLGGNSRLVSGTYFDPPADVGQWLTAAGIVLVRQMPGSAKGVMFITIEDETGIANLVVWPKVFEKQRRAVLGSGMLAVYGRIQRVEDVVHLVAHRLTDLSADLAGVGDRNFPLPHGRGDELHHGSPGVDARSLKG
jgi:error-prone DNA polymerase